MFYHKYSDYTMQLSDAQRVYNTHYAQELRKAGYEHNMPMPSVEEMVASFNYSRLEEAIRYVKVGVFTMLDAPIKPYTDEEILEWNGVASGYSRDDDDTCILETQTSDGTKINFEVSGY
jgi:methyl coenzyme M reductase gamma subunit